MFAVVVLVWSGFAAPASAQRGYFGPGWGGGYHSSTAAEGYQRGYADVVRSAGAYNVMTAEAARRLADAQQQNISNHLQATETYFEMKRINQAYRDETRRKRTPEDLARLSTYSRPERLSPSELDPVTGSVDWPILLQTEPYAGPRQVVEQALGSKSTGALSPDLLLAAQNACDEMLTTLKSRIGDYNPTDYMRSRNFIDGLREELRRVRT